MIDRTKPPIYTQHKNIIDPIVIKKEYQNISCFNIEAESSQLTKLVILLKSGDWFNTQPGLSMLTCELLKSGTNKMSINEFNFNLELNGGIFTVKNGPYYNKVEIICLKRNFQKVLDFIEKALINPRFDLKYLSSISKIIINKLILDKKNYPLLAIKKFKKLIFGPNHPYGHLLTIQDIKKINLEKIATYNREFLYNEPSIFLCTNFDDKIDNILTNFIRKFPKINDKEKPSYETYTSAKKYHKSIKDSAQTSVVIGKILPLRQHKDFIDIMIFNEILGGYFGSRLMQAIREKRGYAYGIYSRIISYSNFNVFFISSEINKKNYKKACNEIYNEILKLQQNLVSIEELNSVKQYLIGKLLISLDGPFNRLDKLVSLKKDGMNFEFYSDLIKRIHSITPKEIQIIGKKYLNIDDLIEVTIG